MRITDSKNVEELYTLSAPVSVGTALTVVGDFEGTPFVTVGTLESIDPIRITFATNPGFLKGDRILLVHNDGQRISEARADVIEFGQCGSHWVCEVMVRGWHLMERRKGDRMPTNLSSELRFISENKGEQEFESVCGNWTNLSESGALMRSDVLLPVGSMVRWRVSIGGGASVHGLALVARVLEEESSMGLEFLDLTSQTRGALLGIIKKAA